MADVKFYRGNLSTLPSTVTDGKIYFVEDERAIYMDHGQNRYRFGCIKVATTEALAHPIADEGQVAYAEDTNILAYYNGTDWVQINAPTDISGVEGRLERIEDALITGPYDEINDVRLPSVIDTLGIIGNILSGQVDAKDSTTAITTAEGTTVYYPRVATTSTDGLMAKEDKTALDAATTAISALQNQVTGLDGAMHFKGVAGRAITDGSVLDPEINGYDFTNGKAAGDVILTNDGKKEMVWTGSAWEEFGSLDANLDINGLDSRYDAKYKPLQTAVTATVASSGTATTFVDKITQDANGVITYTTKTIDLSAATLTWTDF